MLARVYAFYDERRKMSEKFCSVCDIMFKDGDTIVAVMPSTFVDIPSEISFAIVPPTQCLDILHTECYTNGDPVPEIHQDGN